MITGTNGASLITGAIFCKNLAGQIIGIITGVVTGANTGVGTGAVTGTKLPGRIICRITRAKCTP